jgi:N-acetylmuramoyl-L-alanine amidase
MTVLSGPLTTLAAAFSTIAVALFGFTGHHFTGQRSTGQRSTGQRSTGQRSTGQRSTGQRPTGQRPTGERSTGQGPTGERSSRPSAPAAPVTSRRPGTARSRPLAGTVVGVDPGHNGRNYTDPSYIDHPVFNGREDEACNTTGTETDSGYTEALFNWRVATYLVADLTAEGAHVVLTRHNNDGVGPCVTRRAAIMNDAHVDVALAIHADGGPADGRGFAILTPVTDAINHRVISASGRFARVLRGDFRARTGMPYSTYDGVDALQPRDDLAGENLTQVPYALIECGNMRNATDAALLTSAGFQRRAAAGMAAAITAFLKR